MTLPRYTLITRKDGEVGIETTKRVHGEYYVTIYRHGIGKELVAILENESKANRAHDKFVLDLQSKLKKGEEL